MNLQIAVRLTPPIAELAFSGELDFSDTHRVDQAIDLAASVGGCSVVAVDLHDVTFIDCSGIRTLADARQRLEAASSHLWINGLSPQVSRMMRLTGTDGLFGVADLVAH